jgi:formate dehydrogenase gamma subunit
MERTFHRFSSGQRWEHALLLLTFFVLLLTGLPQKYRLTSWSQQILSTPERVELIRTVHHVAAVVLALEALYHLGRGVSLLARRRLPADIFPTMQDIRDAVQMIRYLLFLGDRRPPHGKYTFEQKYTYWFVFFGVAIMGISGFIIWFPILFTRFLPGGVVPAAKLAHSTEAIVSAIFVVLWHFYHVHAERLNLSIFTGRMSESDMKQYHALEYRRLSDSSEEAPAGETQ